MDTLTRSKTILAECGSAREYGDVVGYEVTYVSAFTETGTDPSYSTMRAVAVSVSGSGGKQLSFELFLPCTRRVFK